MNNVVDTVVGELGAVEVRYLNAVPTYEVVPVFVQDKEKRQSCTYITDDLKDAVHTARLMAEGDYLSLGR